MSSEQKTNWDVRGQLKVLQGPAAGQIYFFRRARVAIGRGKRCSITINDPDLSDVHCSIERESNHFVITDHNSRTGTKINGRRVRSQVLHHKDEIEMGNSRLRFTQKLVRVTSSGSEPVEAE